MRTVTLTPAFLARLLQPGLPQPAKSSLLAGMRRLNCAELNAVLHAKKEAKVRKARVWSVHAHVCGLFVVQQ